MNENKTTTEVPVKDYAGGWITEKQGTDAPPFLKFVFPVIGLSCVAYIVIYMNGLTVLGTQTISNQPTNWVVAR